MSNPYDSEFLKLLTDMRYQLAEIKVLLEKLVEDKNTKKSNYPDYNPPVNIESPRVWWEKPSINPYEIIYGTGVNYSDHTEINC